MRVPKTSRRKRVMSLLLAVLMTVSIMPTGMALASEEPAVEEAVQTEPVTITEEVGEPEPAEESEEAPEPAEEAELAETAEPAGETGASEEAAPEEAAPAEEAEESSSDEPSEEPAEEQEVYTFNESCRLDDIIVTVRAPEGVFPQGAELSVSWAEQADEIEEEIEEQQEDYIKVFASYTLDVKVLLDGVEIQPDTAYGEATVEFAMMSLDEDIPAIHNVSVYHTHDEAPEELAADVEGTEPDDIIYESEEDMLMDSEAPAFDGDAEEAPAEVITVSTTGFSPFTLQYHCIVVDVEDTYEAEFNFDSGFNMSIATMLRMIEKKVGKNIFPVQSLAHITKCVSSENIQIDFMFRESEEDEIHLASNCYIFPVKPFEGTEYISFEVAGMAVTVGITCSRKIQFRTLTGNETVLGEADFLTVYSLPDNIDELTYAGKDASYKGEGTYEDSSVITDPVDTPTPGITIAEHSVVVLNVGKDKTLTFIGGDGGKNTDTVNGSPSGGAAGIRLPITAVLAIVGKGDVYAYGGDGVAPGAGYDGGDGGSNGSYFWGGYGGMGGYGGSGAGAAIGGGGGYGGAGGAQANYNAKANNVLNTTYSTVTTTYGYTGSMSLGSETLGGLKITENWNTYTTVVAQKQSASSLNISGTSGNDGSTGGNGESMGTLFVLGYVYLYAKPGTTPITHAEPGDGGETFNTTTGKFLSKKYLTADGGGGGGGGGSGTNTFPIGGGGAGGGGGASGGSGGTAASGLSYPRLHGNVGTGGSSVTRLGLLNVFGVGKGHHYLGVDDQGTNAYSALAIPGVGGACGLNGWNGVQGIIYINTHARIEQDDPEPNEPDPIDPPNDLAYVYEFFTGYDENDTITPAEEATITFYIGISEPTDVTPLTKSVYDGTTFAGYYTEPDGEGRMYYDENGSYVGPTCTGSDFPESYTTILYAYWEYATDGVCYCLDDAIPTTDHRMYFPSLASAVTYAEKYSSLAKDDRCAIYLLEDIYETTVVPKDAYIELHLEGYTVSSSTSYNSVTKTTPNPSFANGSAPAEGKGLFNIAEKAALILEGGAVSDVGQSGRAAFVNKGTLTLTNVTVTARSTGNGDGIAVANFGTLTVNATATLTGEDASGSIGGTGIWLKSGTAKVCGTVYGSDNGINQCGSSVLKIEGGRVTGNEDCGVLNTAGTASIQGNNHITGKTNAIRTTGTGSTTVAYGFAKTGSIVSGTKTGLTNETLYYTDTSVDALTKVSGGYYGTIVYPANLAEGCDCYTCAELGLTVPSDEYGSYPYVVAGVGAISLTAVNATYDGKAHTGYNAEVIGSLTESGYELETVTYEKKIGTSYGTATTTVPVDAGTYRVNVLMSRTLSDKLSVLEGTVEFTISPLAVYVAPTTGQSKAYGEADPVFKYEAYTKSATELGGTKTETFVLCRSTDKCTFSVGRAAGETPGKYDYTLTFAVDGNYTVTLEAQDQFKIRYNKAVITPPEALELTYNGVAQDLVTDAVIVDNDPASPLGSIYYFATEKGVEVGANPTAELWVPGAIYAGDYTVYYRFKGTPTKYYEDSPADGSWATVDVTIDKAVAQIDTAPAGYSDLRINEVLLGGAIGLGMDMGVSLAAPGTGSYPYSDIDGAEATMYYRVYEMNTGNYLDMFGNPVSDEVDPADCFYDMIPRVTDTGTYRIEYYVKGNENYYDSNYNPETGEYEDYPAIIVEVAGSRAFSKSISLTCVYGDLLTDDIFLENNEKYDGVFSWGDQEIYCDFVSFKPFKVTFTPNDGEPEEATVIINGMPRTLTVSWEDAETVFEYDGEEHMPTPTIGNFAFDDNPEVVVTGAASEVGDHTALVTEVLSKYYVLPVSGRECSFVIEPLVDDMSANDTYFTYGDGKNHVIQMVNVPSTATVTYRLESTYSCLADTTVDETLGAYGNHPACLGAENDIVVYTVGYHILTRFGAEKTGTAKVTVNGLDSIDFTPAIGKTLEYNGETHTLADAAVLTVNPRPAAGNYAGKPTITGTEILYAVSNKNIAIDPVANPEAYSEELPEAKNAGNWYVSSVGKIEYSNGMTFYTSVYVTKTVISPKMAMVAWSNVMFTYDGEFHVPTATVLPEYICGDDVVEVELQGGGTDVGSYDIEPVSKNPNYYIYNPATMTILKANPGDFTAPQALELVYNEQEQILVEPGMSEIGELEYSLDGESFSFDLPTGTAKGVYTVYYRVAESDNCFASEIGSVDVTIQSKLLYDIAHAVDGDTVSVVYNEDFEEPVVIDRSITLDMMGKTVTGSGDATFSIPADMSVELRDTKGGGLILNTKEGGSAISVAGTLNVCNDGLTAEGTYAIETLTGGDALIDGGNYTGALKTAEDSSLKIKHGFFNIEVVDPNLYYRASNSKQIKLVAKCVENADAATVAKYPYRVTCSGITLISLSIGHGTTIRYSVYLDRPAENFSLKITREHSGGGTPYTEYPEFSEYTYAYKDAELYYATFSGVNPQCMTNDVDSYLYVDGVQVDMNLGFSVKQYCEKLKASADRDGTLKDTFADMLEYGTAAQYLKSYALDDLANESVYKDQYTPYEDAHQYAGDYTNVKSGAATYTIKHIVLCMGDQAQLYFCVDKAAKGNVNIYVNDQRAGLYSNKSIPNYYYVKSPMLGLQDLGRVVEVKVYARNADGSNGELYNTFTMSIGYFVQELSYSLTNSSGLVSRRYYNYALSALDYGN